MMKLKVVQVDSLAMRCEVWGVGTLYGELNLPTKDAMELLVDNWSGALDLDAVTPLIAIVMSPEDVAALTVVAANRSAAYAAMGSRVQSKPKLRIVQ